LTRVARDPSPSDRVIADPGLRAHDRATAP